MAEIPTSVVPRIGDTKETLTQRISSSGFFDEMYVLDGGGQFGSKRVRLNATDFPLSRRKYWSVVVRGSHQDADGDMVRILYAYTSSLTKPDNWHSSPMPPPVFMLGAHLFHGVRDRLSKASRTHPPNACQLLFYTRLFESCINPHKDNFTIL